MIKSMTGYGSAKGQADKLAISVEVRSVNSRYMDCSIKMPRVYFFAEETLVKTVRKRVHRGKVDVYVSVDSSRADDVSITVNKPLAAAYLAAIEELSGELGLPGDMSVFSFARMPDVLNVEKREADSNKLSRDIAVILSEALEGFDRMRSLEGEKLYEDIGGRLGKIDGITARIEALSPETVEAYRKRLEDRMLEILFDTKIDESRILTEAAIFADRVAVNEEIIRLQSHISQLRGHLEEGGAVGRKMDFLMQELGREANTIGAKCNDMDISKLVIELKAEIEKIREQVQNVE